MSNKFLSSHRVQHLLSAWSRFGGRNGGKHWRRVKQVKTKATSFYHLFQRCRRHLIYSLTDRISSKCKVCLDLNANHMVQRKRAPAVSAKSNSTGVKSYSNKPLIKVFSPGIFLILFVDLLIFHSNYLT